MEFKIEKPEVYTEQDWKITVELTKEERQMLQKLLSIDTDEALKTFKNEDEFQIAKATDGEFTAIHTPKDNGYGVVAILHKDYEFEKDHRICGREREKMEKYGIATFDYPCAYTITNLITKEVEYGWLCVR